MDRMHWNSKRLSRRYEHMKTDLLDRLRGLGPSLHDEAADEIESLGSRLTNALDMLVKIKREEENENHSDLNCYPIYIELCDFLEREGRL